MDEIMGQALWGKVGRLEEAQAAGGSGYAETDKKVIYPAKTLDFVQSDEIGYGVVMLDAPLNFANGDTVIVKWDGTECRCLGYVYDGGFSGFGNLGASEGEGTGEPFAYESSDGMAALIAFEPGQHTVAIYTEAETIHPIDPKFLPEQVVGEEVWGMTLAQGVGQALADGSGLAMVSVTDDAEKATTITEQCTSADKIRFMTGQTTTYEVPFSFKNYENGVLQTAGCSAMLWLNDALYLAHVLLMFGGSAVGAFIVVRPALA